MSQRIRRLALSGDFADLDWTDPANPVPQGSRRFKVTGTKVLFDIIGRASTDTNAVEADVGPMVVDAWVGYLGLPRDPSDPIGPRVVRRGQSVVEATSSTLTTRIRLESVGTEIGSMAVMNMILTGVGGLTAVDVEIVAGARPL